MRKAATATPDNNRLAVERPALDEIIAAVNTANRAPENAPNCTDPKKKNEASIPVTIINVAPKPAPAAEPNKKGSAKGFLKTP